MSRRSGKLLLACAIVVTLAGTGAVSMRWRRTEEASPSSAPIVPVIGAIVQRHDVPLVLTGLGTVTALNAATIRSQVTGLLTSVNFQEGQFVKKGDLLAQIDPRTYQAQLDQAEAALGRDEAHLTNAQANLNRYVPLEKEGFAPEQQVAGQQAAVTEQQNQIKADQAAVDNARTELSYTSLAAPFDGVTGLRFLDVGNIIRSSESNSAGGATSANSLVVVTQVQPISVIFTLATSEIPTVQDALAKGPVTTIAFTQDGNSQLDTGRLLLVDNQADPGSGTVRLKAEFPNLKRRLWPGTFVNVQLMTSVQHDGLTVPLSSIQQGPQGQFVFVVGPDHKVLMRAVAIRQTFNGQALVDKGLSSGETVVAEGQYRLTQGTLVTLVDASNASAVSESSTASAGMLP